MSTANVSKKRAPGLGSSASMPRKPTKIKPGATGTVHLSFVVEAALVRDVDEEAERMKQEDPYARPVSRTDAVRSLLRDGLKYRAEHRTKK